MKKKIKISVWGFIFISFMGVLGHFAYNWLGQQAVFGLLFPINESIWEHLKLLFFPAVAWWLIEWFRIGKSPRFFPVRMWSLALAMAAVPTLYYTYSGVIGQRYSAVDIGIFFVAVALYFLFVHLFSQCKKNDGEGETVYALMLFLVILFSFWVFTFYPPEFAIFQIP